MPWLELLSVWSDKNSQGNASGLSELTLCSVDHSTDTVIQLYQCITFLDCL